MHGILYTYSLCCGLLILGAVVWILFKMPKYEDVFDILSLVCFCVFCFFFMFLQFDTICMFQKQSVCTDIKYYRLSGVICIVVGVVSTALEFFIVGNNPIEKLHLSNGSMEK